MPTQWVFPSFLVVALLAGGVCALVPRPRLALICAALGGWLAFLGFNAYSEAHSGDRELMQGTFWFFQHTLGTLTALVALCGCYVVQRIRGLRSNKAFHSDGSRAARENRR